MRPRDGLWNAGAAGCMEEAEWVSADLFESLSVWVVRSRVGIEERVERGQIEDSHGALGKNFFDEGYSGCIACSGPNVAIQCFKNCQSTVGAVLW